MLKLGIYLGFRPGAGGIFQYSLSLLDALAALPRDKYNIVAAYGDPAWKPYLEPLGIETAYLGECKTLGYWWGMLCLPVWLWNLGLWRLDATARYFARAHMDGWLFPAQDHWTYLSRQPAIGTVHDLMHRYEREFPEVSRFGRYWLREHRYRHIAKTAKAIMVDSEVGKRQLMESYHAPAEKIHPLPYIPPRYIYAAETPGDFDIKFSLPKKFLFYPAQFYPHKNHIRLLQAVAMVRKEHPDIHLVLSGPKNHAYAQVANEAKRLGLEGAVSFIGYVPDAYVPEIYRRARALVMPTFFGPTNIPPLEAQALGCPVAVSGIYGMKQQLGDGAIYFNPRSLQEIVAATSQLWSDDALCEKLKESGFHRTSLWNKILFDGALAHILAKVFR
jgi:glycosyltransferase involved in cell wall biosynthesis